MSLYLSCFASVLQLCLCCTPPGTPLVQTVTPTCRLTSQPGLSPFSQPCLAILGLCQTLGAPTRSDPDPNPWANGPAWPLTIPVPREVPDAWGWSCPWCSLAALPGMMGGCWLPGSALMEPRESLVLWPQGNPGP